MQISEITDIVIHTDSDNDIC